MVGAIGFEPTASWSRTRRASQAALRPESASGSTLLVYAGLHGSAIPAYQRINVGNCYFEKRRTESAIGKPTQKMCVNTAIIVEFHVTGPRRTADNGVTTQYIIR